jgi:MoxR-like ATPase
MKTHILAKLTQRLNQIIVGQPTIIEQLLIALLSDGHVILEGVPGTGKTLLVNVLAKLIQADFRRVQLTPDILPSDILGTNIFDLNKHSFSLKKGPIFTQILLADEINRTPPKTQAALLEAMQERQVTLDGETIKLPQLFWVIATQNPLEFEGTYPLPEAQLDRFLFKLTLSYPSQEAEKKMLVNANQNLLPRQIFQDSLEAIATVEDILVARKEVAKIEVSEELINYILQLVSKTRQHPDLALGTSPRAAVALLNTSKAQAWFNQRDYVIPDDVKTILQPLLRHRLILKPEAQLDGIQVEEVISSLLKQVPVPR